MKRSLKALGLALVAVFAMSALAASAAQAEETPHFTAYNTVTEKHESGFLKAKEGKTAGTQIFKTTATTSLVLECSHVSAEGTTATGTDTTQTMSNVQFSGDAPEGTCTTNPLSLPVHVRMNGCHFLFHVATEEEEDWFRGTADIVGCETEKTIEVEVTKEGGGRKCLDTIGEQTGLGPVTYHNTTETKPTDVDVISHAQNVENTTEGGLLNCGVGNGAHATGVYEGEATVQAENTNHEPIDLTVMQQATP